MLQKECDKNIQKTLELADAMINLAVKGNNDREDSGCGVLYGTLLDAGFKLKQLASLEREAHIKKGEWQTSACSHAKDNKKLTRKIPLARGCSKMNSVKKPVIDLSECVLCDICVDICPDVFIKNDSGYIEVVEGIENRLYDEQGNLINAALLDDIEDAMKNCIGDCISWDEETETESV